MRTLVIDSATAACSAAVYEDGTCVAARHEQIGRGHAERLVPMIGELGAHTDIARIMVNVGPGSFTGVRIGISVARALGFALGVNVQGYGCAAILAAMAFNRQPAWREATVVTVGGHGEYFVQPFARPFAALAPLRSIPFEDATRLESMDPIVGDAADAFVARREHGTALQLWPDAACWHLLDRAQPNANPLPPAPLYGRGPDARMPGAPT